MGIGLDLMAEAEGDEAVRTYLVKIDGVGTDAPTVTDPVTGAKQSASPARLDLIPPLALLHVGAILQAGAAKYGDKNWVPIPVSQHVNHALIHLFGFLAGDTQDDHLGHATCRLQMALERYLLDSLQPGNPG